MTLPQRWCKAITLNKYVYDSFHQCRCRLSIAGGAVRILVGILGVALVATLGDYTWYTLHVRHSMIAGIVHGALLLTAVGAVLGLEAGRLLRGLPIGALAGVGGALTYYLLVALVDGRTYGSAIPASWVALWLILAVLDGRWLRAPHRRPWREMAIRGALAAVLSGIAFFLVMNTLWGAASRIRQELRGAICGLGRCLGTGSSRSYRGSNVPSKPCPRCSRPLADQHRLRVMNRYRDRLALLHPEPYPNGGCACRVERQTLDPNQPAGSRAFSVELQLAGF